MKERMIPEEYCLAVIMSLMTVMVALHVLGRYVLHTSFSYTEEIVRYLFVWAVFLGAAAAVARKRHLSVAGAIVYLPLAIRKGVRASCFLGALFFLTVVAVYGVLIVLLQFRTRQTSAAIGFPMWVVGLAVPVGAVVTVLRLFFPADTETVVELDALPPDDTGYSPPSAGGYNESEGSIQ